MMILDGAWNYYMILLVTLCRIKSWPLSASKVGLSTMCCVSKFYPRRPSLAITLVALSEIGLVGSSG